MCYRPGYICSYWFQQSASFDFIFEWIKTQNPKLGQITSAYYLWRIPSASLMAWASLILWSIRRIAAMWTPSLTRLHRQITLAPRSWPGPPLVLHIPRNIWAPLGFNILNWYNNFSLQFKSLETVWKAVIQHLPGNFWNTRIHTCIVFLRKHTRRYRSLEKTVKNYSSWGGGKGGVFGTR